MRRRRFRIELEIAYCAWVRLAPQWVARYPRPALSPWCELYVDTVLAAPARRADDAEGQSIRRAIIAGATDDQPFPGEIRGKALLLESAVRGLSIARLAEFGTPGALCRALARAPLSAPASRSA